MSLAIILNIESMNASAKLIVFATKTKKGYPLKIKINNDGLYTTVGLKYYLTDAEKKRYWNPSKKQLIKSYPYYNEVYTELEKFQVTNEPEIFNKESFVDYFQNYINNCNRSQSINNGYIIFPIIKTV